MALDVGSRLGHYDVTALIDEGGMGQVYQATDTKLNSEVLASHVGCDAFKRRRGVAPGEVRIYVRPLSDPSSGGQRLVSDEAGRC